MFWRMCKFQERKVILVVTGSRLWSVVQDLSRSYLAQLQERGKWPWCESRKGNAFVCYEQGGHVMKKVIFQSEDYSGFC